MKEHTIINKILLEWAYRVHDGKPNPENPMHLIHLRESLEHLKIDGDVIDLMMNKLYEGTKVYIKGKGPKGLDPSLIQTGPDGGRYYDSDDYDPKAGKTTKKKKKKNKLTAKQKRKEDRKNKNVKKMVGLILKGKSLGYATGSNSLNVPADKKNPKGKTLLEHYFDYLSKILEPGGYEKFAEEEKQRKQKLKDLYGEMDPYGEDMEKVITSMKDKLCGKGVNSCEAWRKVYASIAGKGGPADEELKDKHPDKYPDDMVYPKGHEKEGQAHPLAGTEHPYAGRGKKETRFRLVLKSYIESGGISPITGQVVPIMDMQLDHIQSLDNGGVDGPDNWMWMEAQVNQMKGAYTDEVTLVKATKMMAMTDEEWKLESAENEYKNWEKQQRRTFWTKFFSNPVNIESGLTESLLDSMSGDEVAALIYGYNAAMVKLGREDEQISRNPSQKVVVKLKKDVRDVGKDYKTGQDIALSYTRGGNVRPIEGDPSTYGLQVVKKIPKGAVAVKPQPEGLKKGQILVQNPADAKDFGSARKAYEKSRGSGGRGLTKKAAIQILTNKRKNPNFISKKATPKEPEYLPPLAVDNNTNSTVNKRLNKKISTLRSRLSDDDRAIAVNNAKAEVDAQDHSSVAKEKRIGKYMKEYVRLNPAPVGKDGKVDKKSEEWLAWQKKAKNYEYFQWYAEDYISDYSTFTELVRFANRNNEPDDKRKYIDKWRGVKA